MLSLLRTIIRMSTPSNRRRVGRRHSRRLSQTPGRLRRVASASTSRQTDDVVAAESLHDTCIDLTTDDDDVIDLTSVNDSPAVVLTPIDGGHRRRTNTSRGRGRRGRRSPRSAPPRSQRLYTSETSSEDEELPSFEVTGTPYRPPADAESLTPGSVGSPVEIKISCPICLDDYRQIRRSGRQVMSTTCGHLFCGDCIGQAIRAQHACPTCRKRLSMKQIHPLFL